MTRWNPDEYHRHSSEQQKWARELIGKLNLRGHERVLDIGCGDGKVTAEIAARVPRGGVLGIDLSADMIRFAREHFPPDRYPNLSFDREDASDLDFQEEFDAVFSNAALHWIRDHKPVIRGIERALRPGGRLLLQMGGAGNAAEVLNIIGELANADPWARFFAGFECPYGFHTDSNYRLWLLRAGLRPLRVELIPKDMIHAGPAGLASWIRTTWMPYTDRVPQDMREKLVEEVVDRYVRIHPPDAKGKVHLAMVRLEVEADKPLKEFGVQSA